MIFDASSHISWYQITFIEYSDWAHLLMTLDRLHAQWPTDGWRWWRRTWWSLLGGRYLAALVDCNLERFIFSQEYDFQRLSSVQREIITHCSTWSCSAFRDRTSMTGKLCTCHPHTCASACRVWQHSSRLRWWRNTQDRPLALEQCRHWCVI